LPGSTSETRKGIPDEQNRALDVTAEIMGLAGVGDHAELLPVDGDHVELLPVDGGLQRDLFYGSSASL
jgi:hypothetical protein